MSIEKIRETVEMMDEEIEEVKAEICDHYCKYTEQWENGEDIEDIYDKCPLNRL